MDPLPLQDGQDSLSRGIKRGGSADSDHEEEMESSWQPSIAITSSSSSDSSDTASLEFSMLPDELLVHVGKSVAKLCGIRDFLRLSRTSKRLRRILSKAETIADILQEGNARIHKERSSVLLPSCTSTRMVAHSLEQLLFYERVKLESNLLEENRFNNHPHWKETLGRTIRRLLRQHPSATVVLDAHSGRGDLMATTPYGMFDYRAKHAYNTILPPTVPNHHDHDHDSGISSERVRIRTWGRTASDAAAASQHPYSLKAQKGKGWVEVFLKLPSNNNNTSSSGSGSSSSGVLELPPRPEFYKNVPIPQEQRYQNFVHVDSSDSSSDEDEGYRYR